MSNNIKKTFQPLMALLSAHPTTAVGDLMDDIMPLVTSTRKSKGTGAPRELTFIKNNAGETVAIRDYYFKRWMPLVGDEAVAFGKKANAASGFNSMSVEGLSHWTKQEREASKALANILVDVEAGTLAPDAISDRKEEIEAERKRVEPTTAGFETKEEVIEYLESIGEDLTPAEADDAE